MYTIGEQIIFVQPSTVEYRLVEEGWDVDDLWYDYSNYFVSALNNDGSLAAYQDVVYYGEDEDGNEVELDQPEASGYNLIYGAADGDYKPYTKAMLETIKNTPVNKLDSVCKKVVYLYNKHNNNPNTNFKWRIA